MQTPAPSTPTGSTPTRRRFLQLSVGVSLLITAAGALVPILAYLWPRGNTSSTGGRVLVGATSELPVGKGKVVSLSGKPALVVNTSQGLRAYSAVCTHLGCVVKWDESRGYIWCPCHDGRFNVVTGAVISGPPPAPLAALPVKSEGGQIYLGGA